MELACESVDFGRTIEMEPDGKKVLKAGEPTVWYDPSDNERIVVPATSMEVSRHKKLCSIVVYGQVLVTANQDLMRQLPGRPVHSYEPFDGREQTLEWFMTAPYKIPMV
jgi:hypothetical protein|tara:strand:+ start:167 stop:493 length:327 start_codon:yes stop_codon:yes gene_type:complete